MLSDSDAFFYTYMLLVVARSSRVPAWSGVSTGTIRMSIEA